MDALVTVVLVIGGVLLIFFSLASAFRTVILPRAAFDPLTRVIFLSFRSFLLWLSGLSARWLDRETALSVHAPLGLMAMALAWAIGIMLGFTLLFAATGTVDLPDAMVLAGSSFTTLGFFGPESRVHEILAVFAAILGLAVVALLISFLPTIYGLFSRREVVVADTSIRSGGVAHGPDLVRYLVRGADTTRLDESWADWGHWLITLGETHTSEPSLNFFRSPRPMRSWLTTATAIVDAAVLRNVLLDAPTSVRADMTYRSGREALVEIAHFFFVRPDGQENYLTVLTRADFDVGVRELEKDGVPLVEDLDAAWEEFGRQRSAYEPHVLGLARLILPPPAPWCLDLLERPQQKASTGD